VHAGDQARALKGVGNSNLHNTQVFLFSDGNGAGKRGIGSATAAATRPRLGSRRGACPPRRIRQWAAGGNHLRERVRS